MIKKINHIFLILLNLLFYSCSTNLDYRRPQQYNLVDCRELIDSLSTSRPSNYSNIFPVQPGSLSGTIPGYEQKMDNVFRAIPTILGFIKTYQRKYDRIPKNKEIFLYLVNANKEVLKRLDKLKGFSSNIDYNVDRIIESLEFTPKQLGRIDRFLTEQSQFLNRTYSFRNFNDKNKLRVFKKEFYGPLGELDIFLKLNSSEAFGIFFKKTENLVGQHKEHNLILSKAVEDKKEQFENISSEAFENFKSRFPLIFNRRGDTIDEKVQRAFSWIRSKEIDIIGKINEKKYLIEVKNYSKTIDLEMLMYQSSEHDKSIYTQQKELAEIIDFLELDYLPMAIFRLGITPEAADKLRELGFNVQGF